MTFRPVRWLAAATSILLVGASVGVAASASATPVGPTITVTADNETPGMFDEVVFTATITGYDSACLEGPPTITWSNNWSESGEFDTSSLDGTTLTLTFTREPIGNGNSMVFTASAVGGCAGEGISDSVTLTSPWTQYYAYGYALRAFAPGDWGNVTRVGGVLVELLDASAGPDAEPVSTATTDNEYGAYTLFAPLTSYADMDKRYKIRFTFPDSELTTYYDPSASYMSTSNATWDTTPAMGPCGEGADCWVNTGYSAYIGLPWEFTGDDTISGVAYDQVEPNGSTADDYDALEGVDVDLISWSDGVSSDPVASDVTDSDGHYSLTAPVETQEEADRNYVIRFTYPDEEVRYYTSPAGPSSPSVTTFDDATTIQPSGWDASTSFDGYRGTVVAASETDWSRICDEDGSDDINVQTDSTYWEELCLTDATVEDAATLTNERDDAFDLFGEINFFADPEGNDYYKPTADTSSTFPVGSETYYYFTDTDAWVYNTSGELVNVDISVTRLISGSWQNWGIIAYKAGTSQVADDVPFTFGGNLGSDDSTTWLGQDGYRVSHDNNDDGDPILIHLTTGTDWVTDDGEDDTWVSSVGGQLTYTVGLLDYSDCIVESTLDEALAIASDSGTYVGTNLEPVTGGECPDASWPVETPNLRVGVPFDETFTPPTDSPWDWSEGGTAEALDLPEGLDWELLNEWEGDTPPSIRIFGTPTLEGEYEFSLSAQDDFDNEVTTYVSGTVLAPPTWTVEAPDLRVGSPFDETYTPSTDAPWDWNYGGTAEAWDLPDGLDWELINEWESDTPPSIRIFGTPTEEGEYEFGLWAEDDFNNEVTTYVSGTVTGILTPPTKDASLSLGIEIGEQIEGSDVDVTATGLEEDANYNLELHSTPVTLAFGAVPAGGELLFTTTIPGGLEAGWHSLTLTSRWYDGTDLKEVLWFLIDENGTLLEVSSTAPTAAALASTGSSTDVGGVVLLAAALSLAGMVLVRVRRRNQGVV